MEIIQNPNPFEKLLISISKFGPFLGLFAWEIIEAHELICIYSGEKMQHLESECWGVIQDVTEESYLFDVDPNYTIDASWIGNIMRYANHSHKQFANSVANILFVNSSDNYVVLKATRRINPGEEIVFDY